uniref:Uncharacterized protein n=1 Tax=Arundo donax TaxID=35708 RepID=A0A0A9EJL5_ARUDO
MKCLGVSIIDRPIPKRYTKEKHKDLVISVPTQTKDQSLTDTGACKHRSSQDQDRQSGPLVISVPAFSCAAELFEGLTVKLQWVTGSTAQVNLHSYPHGYGPDHVWLSLANKGLLSL